MCENLSKFSIHADPPYSDDCPTEYSVPQRNGSENEFLFSTDTITIFFGIEQPK
jgi:hypothetical protein